jgi:TPR repeat protein
MHNLGVLLYYESDVDKALAWLNEAARFGFAEAIYNMGVVLSAVGKRAASEPWSIAAAQGGDARAMWNLAMLYNAQDRPELAEMWRERAEASGYSPGDDQAGLPPDVQSAFGEQGQPTWDDGT